MTQTNTFIAENVKLLIDGLTSADEEFAAIASNKHISWMKIVLTDDKPNGNKKRIPQEEFANVIKSVIFMPLKVAVGEIKEGHGKENLPLGVITHAKQEEDRIIALAALWEKERPEDIKLIKERYQNGKQLNVSWEVTHNPELSVEEAGGVTVLRDVNVFGVAMVGMPAYQGRTPVLEVASLDDSDEKTLEENSMENELQETIASLKADIENLQSLLSEKDSEIEQLKTVNTELSSFKEEIEQKEARVQKLASIKEKYEEAGIRTDESYFEERAEFLLTLSDEALEFVIQDLKAFSVASASSGEEVSSITITSKTVPQINAETKPVTKETLAEYLKTRNK